MSAAKGVGSGGSATALGQEEKTKRRGREEAEEIRPRTVLEKENILSKGRESEGGESQWDRSGIWRRRI